MKLYATTTSERASKGQGGNEFITTEHKAGNKDIQFLALTTKIRVLPRADGLFEYQTIVLDDTQTEVYRKVTTLDLEQKAEKKKAEMCNCSSSELPDWHTTEDYKKPC